MKLKKVAALCSKTGIFYLFDKISEGGEIRQWLGDGRAIYPLSGLPILDDENLCAMFDIPEKKRRKCSFHRTAMPEALNVEDWAEGELALNDDWPTVEDNGYVLKPLSTREGIVFIQNAYLAPLEDMADYLQLYERRTESGQTYIVAKNGMEIAAVISPVDSINRAFVEKLEDLARKCRLELEARREREKREQMERFNGKAVDEGQDTLFQDGEEAGEGAEE